MKFGTKVGMKFAACDRLCVLSMSVAMALTVLAGSAPAFAFEPEKPGHRPPALKGPEVRDTGVPGEDRKFGGGGDNKFDRENILPHRMFVKALDVLRGEKAGSLSLSDEQERTLKAIDEEFRSEMTKYREEHKDETRALLADLTPQERRRAEAMIGGGQGGPNGERGPRQGMGRNEDKKGEGKKGEKQRGPRPAGPRGEEGAPMGDRPEGMRGDQEMDAKPTAKSEAAKARLRELFEGAPKPDGVHSKMFAALSADQKAAVEKELASARQEMQSRRDEMYKERVKKDIKGKIDEAGDKGMDPAKIREFIQSLPQAEREKIRDMDPQARREFVRKLWEEKHR